MVVGAGGFLNVSDGGRRRDQPIFPSPREREFIAPQTTGEGNFYVWENVSYLYNFCAFN